mgnify:CR=1 FL=1
MDKEPPRNVEFWGIPFPDGSYISLHEVINSETNPSIQGAYGGYKGAHLWVRGFLSMVQHGVPATTCLLYTSAAADE